MKKKTKEQVQEYFKNAKVIKDKYGDIIHYNNFKLEDIYNDNFDDWIVEDESKDSDILLYCYIKGYAEITEFKETQIPTLEEVRDHFENAKVIKSHSGIKFKGFDQLHLDNEKYYACDESGSYRMVWREELGYAEIIEYKEPIKETQENEALRYNNGKLEWSLVDFDSLEDMVKVLEFGANKYSANNWKKGLKTDKITESLMRHLFAYLRGENIDPESGLPHTGHIMCNAMFLSYMCKFKPDFDSRFLDENKFK